MVQGRLHSGGRSGNSRTVYNSSGVGSGRYGNSAEPNRNRRRWQRTCGFIPTTRNIFLMCTAKRNVTHLVAGDTNRCPGFHSELLELEIPDIAHVDNLNIFWHTKIEIPGGSFPLDVTPTLYDPGDLGWNILRPCGLEWLAATSTTQTSYRDL